MILALFIILVIAFVVLLGFFCDIYAKMDRYRELYTERTLMYDSLKNDYYEMEETLDKSKTFHHKYVEDKKAEIANCNDAIDELISELNSCQKRNDTLINKQIEIVKHVSEIIAITDNLTLD